MEALKSQLKFLSEIEAREIIEEATNQSAKILDEARKSAEQIKNRETREILQKTSEHEVQELESVRLQGKRKTINTRYRLIESVITKSLERLSRLAQEEDSTYRASLERLVLEAARAVGGDRLEVVVHPRDGAFMKRRLSHVEKQVSEAKGTVVSLKMSDEPLRAVGGIILRTEDGKEIFNNTLEARLTKVRQEMLVKIAGILFEDARNE